MKPGFYLKCGMHWMNVSFGIGGTVLNVHTADAAHAMRFDTAQEAEAALWKCNRVGIKTRYYDIVEVL